ncbi:MAG: protein kinase [Chloroflexota bacterium]|nr:protein kinase [Chloroflexota bacterium]
MSTSSSDFIGAKLGTYEIVELIGRGGMGEVYRAIQSNLGRQVAVKVLPPELGRDSDFRARFDREARLTARLEHPAILPIYDYGTQADRPYIVMRLLDGGSLAHRLGDDGRLNPLEVNTLLKTLASALDYAHRQGVIHRDIKPSNILFDLDMNPFIADFGIAQLTSSFDHDDSVIAGTPNYMSPEQVTGQRGDARSDIYSLGIVVFEMLTGRTPFGGETPFAVIMKHMNDAPPALHEFIPDLTPELSAVVAKALAKKPEDRYATAGAFATAFAGAIQPDTARYAALPVAPPLTPPSAGDPALERTATFTEFDALSTPTAMGAFAGLDRQKAAGNATGASAPPPQSISSRAANARVDGRVVVVGVELIALLLLVVIAPTTPTFNFGVLGVAMITAAALVTLGVVLSGRERRSARPARLEIDSHVGIDLSVTPPTFDPTRTDYDMPHPSVKEAAPLSDAKPGALAPPQALSIPEAERRDERRSFGGELAPPPPMLSDEGDTTPTQLEVPPGRTPPRVAPDALFDTSDFYAVPTPPRDLPRSATGHEVAPPLDGDGLISLNLPKYSLRGRIERRALADFNDGDEFAGYKLLKRLDTGDTNRVYHAVNVRNERQVALKLMQGAGERALSRFKQESLILAELQHPHIVQFLDFGVDDAFIYLVMPFLTGHSLKTRLAQGALPPETVIDWTDKFASALSYIHARAIVHRDFRPVNIVFSGEGQPFLTEFSIAKRIGDDQAALGLTMAGEILGTPGYIAPEQRLMGEVSPASDQYSLAVVAFEMLTGVIPFDPPKNMMDNLYAKPKRATALKPELPKRADEVLLRAMELRPDDRYADVRAFCQDLESALTQKSMPLAHPSFLGMGTVTTDAVKLPLGGEAAAGHIFVSYSRAQSGYARRVADWLIAAGFDVWIDDQIDYGDDWWRTIVRAIETCGALVVIMSPEAEASDWVQREVGNALKFKKTIYPLLYTGENWSLFVWTQYADVRVLSATTGTIDPPLPPADFLDRLAKSAPRKVSPGREVTVPVTVPASAPQPPWGGVKPAPMPSSSLPMQQAAPQAPPAPTRRGGQGGEVRSAAPQAPMGDVKPIRHEIIRILFLSADPKNERRVRLSDELHDVDEYLRKSEYRDRFDLKEAWAVQIADLQGYLLRYKPHIVHFSGHGSREGAILLQDAMGNAAPVHPGALSNLFATLKDNIRCVVLNACYSEIQARAIVQHIDCVIGMSYAIKDSSAVKFAGQFYQALGYGRHIGTAFNLGKNALELYDTGEETTPQMLIRAGLQPDEITLVN